MNLMHGVDQYLDGTDVNMGEDGFGFRQVDLFLDEKEFYNFRQDLVSVIQNYALNEPDGKRRRRTLATVMIPEAKK
ncbi:hypothetical protein H1D32_11335 [Anaerobacillus sp. CMMVII]|uniref:hypothetical protein n=1 Tax=Anaerobacillus sp. CMMVII TaxID=2755588 RepID=UPI0021B790AB|nr:hypothetical protein [Anaerobacillus sp. CMMVII]MCT8138291.1 hypothetical protein [Anaerobacillus sp. CMMVII]